MVQPIEQELLELHRLRGHPPDCLLRFSQQPVALLTESGPIQTFPVLFSTTAHTLLHTATIEIPAASRT